MPAYQRGFFFFFFFFVENKHVDYLYLESIVTITSLIESGPTVWL